MNLILVCSQITNELNAITVPGLELKMCDFSCLRGYFKRWASMGSRVISVEAPFDTYFDVHPDPEHYHLKEKLLWYAGPWATRVDFVTVTTFPHWRVAKGTAVFRRTEHDSKSGSSMPELAPSDGLGEGCQCQ